MRTGWDRSTDAPKVTADDIAEVVSMWTGVPVMQIAQEESERLLQMEEALHKRIVGQDEAIAGHLQGRAPGARRPEGSPPPHRLLHLPGPDRRGQDRAGQGAGRVHVRHRGALVQLDMSEFMERHTVSRLVGAPPGYVGYEEAGQLTEAIRRRPYSIVVFDEVEKAHPEAHNMLLQIMEEAICPMPAAARWTSATPSSS